MEGYSEKHIDITMEKVILDHIQNNKISDDDITLTDTNKIDSEEVESIEDTPTEEENVEVATAEETITVETITVETPTEEATIEETIKVETPTTVTTAEEATIEETITVETPTTVTPTEEVTIEEENVMEKEQTLVNNLIDINLNKIFNDKAFDKISNKRSYSVKFYNSANKVIKTTTAKLCLKFCKVKKTFYITFDNTISIYLKIDVKTKTVSKFYLTKKHTLFTKHFNMPFSEIKRITVN